MRKLTDLEAETIRWMKSASGIVTVPEPAMIVAIYDLMADGLVSVTVSSRGRQALADYDRQAADPHGRRLANGMSSAGRSALTAQSGREGQADG